MNKEQIELLAAEANESIANVAHALRTLTADKPLILFDKDNVEGDEDEIYDLPIGYNVGKYDSYSQGAVWKVEGDDVTLFLTGEEFGELWHQKVDDLPFSSQVDLLSYLIERE